MKNIIILAIVFGGLFFLYRSCTQGYTDYAFFVHVKNEAAFKTILSDSDTIIVEHGRRLTADIIFIDQEIDKGDGPDKGLVRWYVCSGIDCDERWQQSFLIRK
ncbi:MAG: hypothetical protein KAJ62_08675 [Desulfobacteraceae bacterium]|nr:hypothetical protein [Desulfobacteraceae bacterium]